MGVKIAWIAIKEENISKINLALNLSDMTLLGISVKEQEEYSNNSSNRIDAFLTEKGWYFMLFRYLPPFIEEKLFILSKDAPLVMFSLTETSMCSTVEYWLNGINTWSIAHCGSKNSDIYNLDKVGTLPDSFESIQTTIFENQRATKDSSSQIDHIIEIPSLMAKMVTGYKHDEGFTNGDKIIKLTETILSRESPASIFKRHVKLP